MTAPVQLLVDAPIEQLLVTYLRDTLPSLGYTMAVGTRVPSPRPAESVTLFRIGGARPSMVVDQASISFEVRAKLERRAEDIMNAVRALTNAAALEGQSLGGWQVHRVQEWASPANLPDPLTGTRYTYQASFDIRSKSTTVSSLSFSSSQSRKVCPQ